MTDYTPEQIEEMSKKVYDFAKSLVRIEPGIYILNETLVAIKRNGITVAFVNPDEPEASAPRLKEERDGLLEALDEIRLGFFYPRLRLAKQPKNLTCQIIVTGEELEDIIAKIDAIIAKVEK